MAFLDTLKSVFSCCNTVTNGHMVKTKWLWLELCHLLGKKINSIFKTHFIQLAFVIFELNLIPNVYSTIPFIKKYTFFWEQSKIQFVSYWVMHISHIYFWCGIKYLLCNIHRKFNRSTIYKAQFQASNFL